MGFNVSPMVEEDRSKGIAIVTDQPYYGTFQGVANYYPSPNPPTFYGGPHTYHQGQGYHTLPVYVVAEGRLVREHRLPCCGLGLGWFFIVLLLSKFLFSCCLSLSIFVLVPYSPNMEKLILDDPLWWYFLRFIIGFFLGGVPWYIGAFILVCVQMDYREKPGLIACTVASLVAVIAFTLGVAHPDLAKLT